MPVRGSLRHSPQWTLYPGGVTSILLLDSSSAKSSVTDWSKAGDPSAVRYIYWTKAESHRQWSEGITGISEAEQRRKQYQAGVEVTGTGSEVQGQAVRGHTQR